jgi:disulfide bond formation protein DsbB
MAVAYFQYVQGLAPCKLCIWQRFPYVFNVIIGSLILLQPKLQKVGALLALISISLGTALAGYHTGIEASLWPGPQSCSGTINLNQLSPELFLKRVLSSEIVRCDQIPWSFLNISMAGWNLVVSFVLTSIWARLVVFNLNLTSQLKS